MNINHALHALKEELGARKYRVRDIKMRMHPDPYSRLEWMLNVDIGTERMEWGLMGTEADFQRVMREAREYFTPPLS